jgi:hypothetical protein
VSEFTLMASVALVRVLVTGRGQDVHLAISGALQPGNGRDDLDSLVSQTCDQVDTVHAEDEHAERELIFNLNRRLQQIVSAEPSVRFQLRKVVFDVLLPRLSKPEQARVIRIQISASSDQVINRNFLGTRDHIDRQRPELT